jgi:hypothetical protein
VPQSSEPEIFGLDFAHKFWFEKEIQWVETGARVPWLEYESNEKCPEWQT